MSGVVIETVAVASNPGPCFDVLAFAVDVPASRLTVVHAPEPRWHVEPPPSGVAPPPAASASREPGAILLARLGLALDVRIERRLPPDVGLGVLEGEALALARAATLLGADIDPIASACDAVREATGHPQAHVVAAAALGGAAAAWEHHPPRVRACPVGAPLFFALVTPAWRFDRATWRAGLPAQLHFRRAASVGASIAWTLDALAAGDLDGLGRALSNDPVTEGLGTRIPGFLAAATAARRAGAIAAFCAGDGPTLVAIAPSQDRARAAAEAARDTFQAHALGADLRVAAIAPAGHRPLHEIAE